MKPFRDYDLSAVIHNQLEAAHTKIDNMSNEEIMANNLEVLAENIYQEFFIEPITLFDEDFSKRSIQQGKIQKYIDPFFRIESDKEYVEVDGIIASFSFPYTGDADLFKCRASTFSLGPYPEITVYSDRIVFCFERSLSEMNNPNAKENLLSNLEHDLQDIKTGISYANGNVISFNNSLKSQSIQWLEEKKRKVSAFFSIASMFEVPIEKKAYAETHIPLQRHINPVSKHYDTSNYYSITDRDYLEIISTIKHTASTYERTPGSYKALHEEDLRNTLLATLNATYKGDATGETFRNAGKTDICIERENRAAFVAECKMWTGPKEIPKAVEQLDSYLTWRDCKTALIYFVRRKDFFQTLTAVETSLRSIEGMKNVTPLDKNEFECLYLSKSNPGQLVKIRVMLFNLYCGA